LWFDITVDYMVCVGRPEPISNLLRDKQGPVQGFPVKLDAVRIAQITAWCNWHHQKLSFGVIES
jgi:hypothetical protein